MSGVAVVFRAETRAGQALCRRLRDRGWTVFGENAPTSMESLRAAAEAVQGTAGHVDMLVVSAAAPPPGSGSSAFDFAAITRTYETVTLDAIRFIEAFLPLTGQGLRRLCFVTGSSSGDIGSGMATTALHMACKNLFNDLHRDGYAFRLFLPDPTDEEASAEAAAACFTAPPRNEDRLVISDFHGKEQEI